MPTPFATVLDEPLCMCHSDETTYSELVGTRRARVAIVDSGIGQSVKPTRLIGQIAIERRADGFVVREEAPVDKLGHGSLVAARLVRLRTYCEVLSVRVFDGEDHTDIDRVIAGIRTAVEQGVNIIHLSLSTPFVAHARSLYAACTAAANQGICIVASTYSPKAQGFPASFQNVLAVAPAAFSCRHAIRVVDSRRLNVEAAAPLITRNGVTYRPSSLASTTVTYDVCRAFSVGSSLRAQDLISRWQAQERGLSNE